MQEGQKDFWETWQAFVSVNCCHLALTQNLILHGDPHCILSQVQKLWCPYSLINVCTSSKHYLLQKTERDPGKSTIPYLDVQPLWVWIWTGCDNLHSQQSDLFLRGFLSYQTKHWRKITEVAFSNCENSLLIRKTSRMVTGSEMCISFLTNLSWDV